MSRLAALIRRVPNDPRPDGLLLAAFLADRDEFAFAELVRRHAGLVWGVCRRGLPDHADAEDAFQATFLVLVRRAGGLTAAHDLGPWLYKVAAWTAGKLRRRNARRFARAAPLPADVPAPAPAPPVGLDAALLRLPERYRAPLVLCYLEGLTHREAAARLGCPAGTVSSLVSRGLARLRAGLAGRDLIPLFAAATVAAPADLAAAAVRSAAAFRIASASAASPAVAQLTEGVLRMFWVKKLTTGAVVSVVLLGVGLGLGTSVREAPRAVAADPVPPPAEAVPQAPAPKLVPGRVPLARLELLVGGDGATGSFQATEFRATGEPVWHVTFRLPKPGDAAPVRDFLARAVRGPDGPPVVAVVATPTAGLSNLYTALGACKEAGVKTVRFTGYLPLKKDRVDVLPTPGPDGGAAGFKRFADAPRTTEDLMGEIMSIWMRC